MDVSHLLDPLNDAQREAVAAEPGNLLILAGAGSGKTRVLTHRTAWYIQTGQTRPTGVLAVTFTNKAAAEMRGRLQELLGAPVGGMWVGTFHSVAHRLLRIHWKEAELPQGFQILDSDDQYRTIRRATRALGLDEKEWSARESQWFINSRKDEGLRSQHLESGADPGFEQMVRIYRAYEEACERGGLVDFAELLLRAYELWAKQPALLDHYRQRFKHLLVDEFQDTNAIQYAWLRLLTGEHGHLFAVGDDDQSIYSWRGARAEHMQQFEKDFSNTRLIRLEQNYRSTKTVLAAANALITNNTARLGKNLWTDAGEGESISLYAAYNEVDEARFVTEHIQDWQANGRRYDETAVLYRVSAQSRVFEDALRQTGIPYRVHGGFRFYERLEVKDALAYLRLVALRDDDAAFERVVNTPTRGIGQRTLETIRALARLEKISMWRAAAHIIKDREMAARALTALEKFLRLITELDSQAGDLELHEAMDLVIKRSGLVEHYRKDKTDKALDRIENLEELVTAANDFSPSDDEEMGDMDALSQFLAHAALESGQGQADAHEQSVQLMTLHSAKGLEYPLVCMVGMEEGLFPHRRSSESLEQLEEERRLCYVGITRAKERLLLTHAEVRRLHGSESYPHASRFIHELPEELVSEVRLGGEPAAVKRPTSTKRADGVQLGQRVTHARFGEGVVLNLEGRGEHARVQVNFERSGAKWLVLGYAGLQPA